MEWPNDFQYSPLMDESLFGLLSSSHELEMMEPKQSEWTDEEKKLFMNALSEIDPTSPAFLENVASRIPWKSIEDIKNHYQSLLDDIQAIESDKVPLPDYPVFDQQQQPDQAKKEESQVDANVKTRTHQRRRGVPWTEEEHQLFLMGLNKYGKGDWRSISRYYVITKTPTQVASHAQKYFRRQTSSTPPDRRRPSIHDIQTVTACTPNNIPIPNFMINNPAPNPAMMYPSTSTDDMMSMMNMMINTNPNFVPADDGHIIFNHNNPNLPAAAAGAGANYGAEASSSSSPFMLPSMMNLPYWG